MNEKRRAIHPVLAVLTVLFMFVQAFCMTAFGAESREVCIPAGTGTLEVNEILTEALVPDSEETLKWEYRCEGKEVNAGLYKNTAWGSIGGFESTAKKILSTYTYTHPALSENQDGTY